VVALVVSRLDYGSGALINLLTHLVRRFQSVQLHGRSVNLDASITLQIQDRRADVQGSAHPGHVVRVADLPSGQALYSTSTSHVIWCHASNLQQLAVGISQWLILKSGLVHINTVAVDLPSITVNSPFQTIIPTFPHLVL